MRSRRVPVLRLGSRGPGGDARLLRLWTQAFAIVRNRSQASASVRGASDLPERRKSSGIAELSSLFTFRVSKVSTITGIGGVVLAKARTVVTFRLVSGLRVSKLSVNSHRDRGGRETQICRHFWTRLGSSRLKPGGVTSAEKKRRFTLFQSIQHFSKNPKICFPQISAEKCAPHPKSSCIFYRSALVLMKFLQTHSIFFHICNRAAAFMHIWSIK